MLQCAVREVWIVVFTTYRRQVELEARRRAEEEERQRVEEERRKEEEKRKQEEQKEQQRLKELEEQKSKQENNHTVLPQSAGSSPSMPHQVLSTSSSGASPDSDLTCCLCVLCPIAWQW